MTGRLVWISDAEIERIWQGRAGLRRTILNRWNEAPADPAKAITHLEAIREVIEQVEPYSSVIPRIVRREVLAALAALKGEA